MSKFASPLIVELTDEFEGLWTLRAPLLYLSDIAGRIEVPVDFVTDFASVPKLPVVYLAAGGKGDKAAVVHDWLYSALYDREVADRVLREALLTSGYSSFLAGMFYAAVRGFGASHYKKENVPQTPAVTAVMNLA